MGKHINVSVLLVLAIVGVKEIEMVPEYLKSLSGSLMKVMKTCNTELGMSEGIMTEFYQLWKENYEAVSRDAGCVLHCMSQKLDLFNVGGDLKHGDTKEFVMKHGADAKMATQLADIMRVCQEKVAAMQDDCVRVLEMAKCIRGDLRQVNWSPNEETLIVEIAAEV